ncbi:hypothetical protein PFISCL1PPCAC_19158, partial [Pristionchus fissidentatus]
SPCLWSGDDSDNINEFRLLDLPNELISHIFSFMRHGYRIVLRVNGRLDGVELRGRYYQKSMILRVGNESVEFEDHDGNSFELPIRGNEGKRAIDELKRVVKNTQYGEIICEDPETSIDSTEEINQIFSTVYAIRARFSSMIGHQIVDDFSLLTALKNKKTLHIRGISKGITGEGLFRLSHLIRFGEVDAKEVEVDVSLRILHDFLVCINDQEFEDFQELFSTKSICLRCGNFEIDWVHWTDAPREYLRLSFILYEEGEVWEKRKKIVESQYTEEEPSDNDD